MDAHTLNAWTRFALQKGGIGSCTALIDNPASDAEDLMFMQGEKIIVLRRLEDEAEGSVGSSRRSQSEVDAWYLGYCEGVVGRFKGAHVQFHGKLKKPVLMRRSGVGQIRESSTKPMSKAEAASLHLSQVPPGIPVTAVDSDDEGQSFDSHRRTGPGRNSGASLNGSPSQQMRGSLNKYPSTSRLPSARAQANLGVTTPPLSDENHARERTGRVLDDSDSVASETVLPWARGPVDGAGAARNEQRRTNPAHIGGQSNLPPSPISSTESPVSSKQKNGADADGPLSTPRINVPNGHLSTASSLSTSNTSESEEDHRRRDHTFSIYDLYGRDSVAFPNFAWRDQAGRLTDSKSGESLSVQAAPNSRPGSGLRPRSPVSGETTPEPRTPVDRKPPSEPTIPQALRSPSRRRPNAAPPPNTPGLSIATSLRRKVEATATSSSPVQSPPMPSNAESQHQATTPTTTTPMMGFDPKRRPSAASRLAGAVPGAGRGTPDSIRGGGSMDGPSSRPDRSMPPPSGPVAPRPSQAVPRGFYPPATQPMAPGTVVPPPAPVSAYGGPEGAYDPEASSGFQQPRGSFSESRQRHRSRSSSNLQLSLGTGGPSSSVTPSPIMSGQRSPFGNGYGERNSARGSGSGPTRASSDRTSVRERVGSGMGSGMLKKNPSNPAPGLHGGMQGLTVNTNTGGHSSGQSRSPSPLSAVSGVTSAGTSASVMGAPSFAASPFGTSPMGGSSVGTASPVFNGPGGFGRPNLTMAPRVMSVPGVPPPGFPQSSDSDRPLAVDSLGFIVGTGAPVVLPREDPDAMEKWQAILAEGDVAGARKSRKVRKLVEAGIPASMRPKVWGFLANSSYRRRPGLFEQLCKASQGPKGRKGKEVQYEAIDKDLDRCYPDHQLFHGQNGTGRADLEAILKAYVHYNPIIGYTQGMGLVAGLMLILMPAEDAFWLLCALLRDVHMEGYYSSGLKQLHVDGIVFGQLLQGMDADLAGKLSSIDIEPINFTPNWFLPLFVRVLPWDTVLRTWDVFFYEGPTWILRVALAIVRILRDPLMNPVAVPLHGEGMRLLLHPPQQLLTPDNVLGCALSVRLKDGEIRKLSRNASKLVRQSINPRGRSGTPTSSAARSTSTPPGKR